MRSPVARSLSPPSVGELLVRPPGLVATRPSAAQPPCLQHLPHTPLLYSNHSCTAPVASQRRPAPTHALPPTPLCRFVCTEWGGRHQRRSLPLHWCRYVDSACSRGLTSPHFSAGPSLAQPLQRGRLQRPAAVLRQPLLSCFSGGGLEPLCRIASIQHARSPDTRGFSLSLSQTHLTTRCSRAGRGAAVHPSRQGRE
jgi:hypothetical protein